MSLYRTGIAPSPRDFAATDTISYLVIAAASALVSLWLILLNPVITGESVARLQEASLFMATGGVIGHELESLWPFALTGFHRLSGFSLLTTAHLFSSGLYLLACLAFVATVKTLGGNSRVQVLAALTVLVHPLVCDSRGNLALAPGYWAFTLLALRQLLIYCRHPGWPEQIKWFAYIAAATLFQFEALVLANLAPLVLMWALPRRRRMGSALKLLIPMWIVTALLVISGGLTAIALAQGNPLPADVEAWGRLANTGDLLPDAVAQAMPQLANDPQRGWVVVGGLLGLLAASVSLALTPVCLLLLLLGWWRRDLTDIAKPARSLINAHAGSVLLYLAVYTILGRSVSQQDLAPAVLVLLLYLPFILEALWRRGPRLLKLLVLSTLLFLASGGLYNRKYEQQYVADASDWLRGNTPATASLISNHPYITHFSGRGGNSAPHPQASLEEFLADGAWRRHQFIALQVTRAGYAQWHQLAIYPQLEVLRVFANQNRDMVVVLENTAASSRG